MLHDPNFNVTALVNRTGWIFERYEYTPYGQSRTRHSPERGRGGDGGRTVYSRNWSVGDLNYDGVVNYDDEYVWYTGYAKSPQDPNSIADLDGDGDVDEDDYTLLFTMETYQYQGDLDSVVLNPYLESMRGQGAGGLVPLVTSVCDVGHQGLFFDKEFGVYRVRSRDLHVALMRWMQRDPREYADGMSMYEDVRSNPLAHLDPQGEGIVDEGYRGYLCYRLRTAGFSDEDSKYIAERLAEQFPVPSPGQVAYLALVPDAMKAQVTGVLRTRGYYLFYTRRGESPRKAVVKGVIWSIGDALVYTDVADGWTGQEITLSGEARELCGLERAGKFSMAGGKAAFIAAVVVKAAGVGDIRIFGGRTAVAEEVVPPPSSKPGVVRPYEVDTYGNLRARSQVGDGLALDHQPSNASNLARAEAELGRPLTAAEREALRGWGTAVAVPEQWHVQHSRTYGARNAPFLIQADSLSPQRAAVLDSQRMIDGASAADRAAVEAAAAEIIRRAAGR